MKQRFFKNTPPWLTEEVRKATRERDVVRRLWRRTRKNEDYDKFKVLRNRVKSMVRQAKRSYYLNAFHNTDNANRTWNRLTIRHLGLIKDKGNSVGLTHSVEELNEYFSGSSLCNDFNEHDYMDVFAGIFNDRGFVTSSVIRRRNHESKI